MRTSWTGLAAALVLAAPAAASNLPLKINFSGRLVDPATDEPRNGSVAMTFRLYAAAEGGTALYTETQAAVPVSNGVFATRIGEAATLSPDLFAGASAYLGLQVESDAEMTPRWQLLMSAYAMTASQLSGDAQARVIVGGAASTFTAAGNLLVPHGIAATTATFSAASTESYGLVSSSGILAQAGTLRAAGAGGVHAEHGVRAGSVTAVTFFQSDTPGSTPAVSPAGGLRAYFDATRDAWLTSVNGRAYLPLGTMALTLWNSNATGVIANQGQNLPAALTELDAPTQGTRMLIDCDDLPARLALRYNFRTIQAANLTIIMSVRDVTDTNNVLVSASQSVNAIQNWTGAGAFSDKPVWCAGTQTVAVYTSGGNGARDMIFKQLGLVGRP
ncbi:MAG: hypothetical protein SF051_10410 [Elusimicrobiota bacterium]|nr:hypothetical protein [Elusimicrobiota bacterium]